MVQVTSNDNCCEEWCLMPWTILLKSTPRHVNNLENNYASVYGLAPVFCSYDLLHALG